MTTALYRRYRPDTFDQVIGQEHVTEPLKAALRANRVTHAYLFSGPRGCGKTTSARILARCLNCAQGPTDTPCGQCESCRELATGGPGSLDVVEIDAASHGGVDDARDLRERATFAPVRDRYKIFIIDEAHMVTNQGFNALLKLVEEPPEHVKFVFATTEPERVIGTIRSRTHHYPFRLVPPDVLGPYLTGLCAEEHIGVGEGVLTLVMRAGGGSVRDTLSVLDQLMAGAIDGQVTYQTAVALLGYTDSALLDESVDALAGGDGAAAFRVVERMVESGHDPRRFVEDLLQRLRDLLIIAVAGDGARDVLADTPHDQFERMQRQAQNWGPHGLSRAADLTDEALRAMTGATSPRLQLELLVGRILVPAPAAAPAQGPVQGTVGMTGGGAPREASAPSSSEASSGRFGAREAREALARKKQERAEASAPAPQAPASSAAPAPQGGPAWGSVPDWSAQKPVAPEPSSAPAEAARQEAPRREAAHETASAREAAPAQAEQRPAAPPQQSRESGAPQRSEAPARAEAPASGRDADMLRGRWNEVVERLSSISRVTWSMVGGNAQLGAVDGSRVVLLFPVEAMVNAFSRGPRAADVEKAINEVTGLTVSVSAQVGQASGGPATTGPSAQASHPGPAAQHSQPGGWVSEPPPFDEAAAQAAPQGDPEPADTGWPETARAPEPAPEPELVESAWPEPATVTPIRRNEPVAPAPAPIVQAPDPQPTERPALPERAARALAQAPADTPEAAQASSPNGDAAPRKRSFTVFRYPGDPEPADAPADAPAQPEAASASSPVFDDAPIEPAAHTPSTPTGWGDPVVISGGASVNFDDGADSWTPPESAAPADVTPISAAPSAPAQAPAWLAAAPEPTSAPAPGFGAPEPQRDATAAPGGPLTGRAAAEAALREKAQREAATVSTRTHAADDDSASIDDENIENSQTIGLAAVLEILGGRVIEEKMTEGGY
ncbi:DNA polymerase III subunit gamma and tau [Schaalia odontolytica]|uniref:DNA polymerase III subunit gamma and tau n=1 Tax=Actinomycetaceae TaxID=2049 RepID=UPI0004532D48|nr:DNA polymerase III subunit gamma and tau [Actinomyces sp. ICM54]EWC97420.1 DNA polymerase III, subunit gamma and tau [Actinomyces sp. ICM54]MCQ5272427.1 DNA polymerase III subunit gamma and tau [Schaalia odontolytica]